MTLVPVSRIPQCDHIVVIVGKHRTRELLFGGYEIKRGGLGKVDGSLFQYLGFVVVIIVIVVGFGSIVPTTSLVIPDVAIPSVVRCHFVSKGLLAEKCPGRFVNVQEVDHPGIFALKGNRLVAGGHMVLVILVVSLFVQVFEGDAFEDFFLSTNLPFLVVIALFLRTYLLSLLLEMLQVLLLLSFLESFALFLLGESK